MIEVVGTVITVMFALCLMFVTARAVILNLFDREQEKELEAELETE